ncbi:hypothetical protein [Halorussus pelagicus]|uniref:hypothetical protein n=1 Tax=Halorussus pelagicus TaxID=2505977 RepID=UPI000FFCBAC3|nr:hypothetical protein [Halorussus pelagicus]
MADRPKSFRYTRQQWVFMLVFAAVTGVTWYLTEPTSSRFGSAVIAGLGAFLMMALVFRLSGEQTRQTVLDLISFLFP